MKVGSLMLLLIALMKLMPFVKYVTIATFPERFYTQVPELVVVTYMLFAVAEFMFEKCILVAPLVLY